MSIFRKSPNFVETLLRHAKELEDTGARNGLHGITYDGGPPRKRIELEQAARLETERELGKPPELGPLRAEARAAVERLREAKTKLEEVRLRPLGIHRRILLGVVAGCSTTAIALFFRADALVAAASAVAIGLLVGYFAPFTRLWGAELGERRAARRDRIACGKLESAQDRLQLFTERLTKLVEQGETELGLAYEYGRLHGARHVELTEERARALEQTRNRVPPAKHEAANDTKPLAPAELAEATDDWADTLPDLEWTPESGIDVRSRANGHARRGASNQRAAASRGPKVAFED
jgi:hypothetical protein